MDDATPVRARCLTHPGVAAVAFCDSCGGALCLDCAIPVRGEVIGIECLATRVPDSPPPAEAAAGRRTIPDRVSLGGLLLALLASLLPWTQFGVADGAFGGWGTPLRYGSLVGPLAAAGLLAIWLASRPGTRAERVRAALAVLAGTLVVIASLLAIGRPPPFTRPSAGPYVAIAGGLTAALAWPVWARLRPDRTKRVIA